MTQPAGAIWACVAPGDRAGDIDQVKAIAGALDPGYLCVDLACEHARLRHLAQDPAIRYPRAIVGIGRKRIAMAAEIRAWSGGTTKLIHVGRDRGSLGRLDCLVTTPAFPIAPSPKVLALPIVPSDRIRRLLAGAQNAAGRSFATPAQEGICAPWINVFLGNPLRGDAAVRSQRLMALAAQLDRLALVSGHDLLISGSPRTAPECYDRLSEALASRHQIYRWRRDDPLNPFETMLLGTRDSVVTADSITMISQLVAAGHRALIFPWRVRNGSLMALRRLFTRRSSGTVARGKDIDAFCAGLYEECLAAPLEGAASFEAVRPQADLQDRLFQRLQDFLR